VFINTSTGDIANSGPTLPATVDDQAIFDYLLCFEMFQMDFWQESKNRTARLSEKL
jgi:hypothetical protein